MPDKTVLELIGALLTIATVLGGLKVTANSLAKGQDRIETKQDETGNKLDAMKEQIAKLATASALNDAAHKEMNRRMGIAEVKLDDHDDQLRSLHTKVHDMSGKVQELDPKWRPYGGD